MLTYWLHRDTFISLELLKEHIEQDPYFEASILKDLDSTLEFDVLGYRYFAAWLEDGKVIKLLEVF